MQTRRNFGRLIFAGIPAAFAFGKGIDSTVEGVVLGASTYSFRDLPRTANDNGADVVIPSLTACGVGTIELFSPTIEPVDPAMSALFAEMRKPGASSDPKAMRAKYEAFRNGPEAKKARENLRQWRISTPTEYFTGIKKKFDDAGINIYTYTINFGKDYTDEEIDAVFNQAKALGTDIIASSTQITIAKRLVPFAEKHKVYVALHGHDQTSDPNEFSTPESFQTAMDMSKYFKVNLDIGHFTAGNYDPVAYIQEHHERITHLHMKDRKKDHGPNTPWGEGDTPIKQVLLLLKAKKYPIPALVEYEYRGTGTPVEEVRKCMDYMKQVLTASA